MIKRILPIALIGAVILGTASCQSGSGFKKANGVEYKIINDAPGKPAQPGDVMELNIVWKVGKNDGKSKDSAIIDSRKMNGGKPIQMPLSEPKFRGDLVSGLALLSAGDSAIIRVSFDSLKVALKGQQMPPFAKPGDYFIYEVKMVSVKSRADYENEMKAKSSQLAAADDKTLQDYFAKNNLKPEKTASGLYYTIQKDGSGDKIGRGQSASLIYTGKLLDGTTFDSNVGKPEAFTVKAGTGSVIPGFDEGIMLLKKGTKATLYIPSPLAYGEHSPSPSMPPNSILIFELEVTDVK